MKKILVIGANSFIGINLIHQLKNQADIIGVYHSNKERLVNEVENVSVNDLENLNTGFDEVYLLSAFIPDNKFISVDERRKMFTTNVEFVNQICTKFKDSKIIYVSTVSVYKSKNGIIVENDAEGGLNEYGISKLWGEKIISKANNFSIVRLSSVYGIGMKQNTIIPNYISQALENNNITVWGDGKREQNYIHVFDAVNFLKNAGSFVGNDIFLATAPQSISNYELAKIIADKTGCAISFMEEDATPSFYYDNNYTVNKLQNTTVVSFDKGITELIEWTKEKY